LVAELAVRRDGVHAAVVELDPLPDAVRAGAEDDDARLRPARRGFVHLAPGRVVVVGRGLDLARARVDAAVRRLDSAIATAPANCRFCRPGGGGDLCVREAEALEPEEVAGDERLDIADRLEPGEDPIELALEERVDIRGDVDERLPRRCGAGVELARAKR